MLLRSVCFLSLLLTLSPERVPAQPDPIEWGEVPDEHLTMNRYEPDTTASAVILADYGQAIVSRRGTIDYIRHRRVKILSEAGYDWGNVSVLFHAGDRMERVRDVEGQTFTVGSDGEIQRHEMDDDAVYTEEINERVSRLRFTLPALEPGAVVEYRYTLRSSNPVLLRDWAFQAEEPTLWSEFRAMFPPGLRYVWVSIGTRMITEKDPQKRFVRGERMTQHRWVMEDVPALREEPFVTTLDDYRAAIKFQLHSIEQGVRVVPFLNTWPGLAKELVNMKEFGRQANAPRRVRRYTRKLVEGVDDPVERMRILYDDVRTSIDWNGRRGVLARENIRNVLKARSGSAPSMTFLLIAMLRTAGIEADPVLVSTREHGKVVKMYPLLSQFNAVLACARIDGETYLMEPSDPLRPYDVLPARVFNGQGWLVREDHPKWISMPERNLYRRRSLVNVRVDAEGTLTGMAQVLDHDYSGLLRRRALSETYAETGTYARDELLGSLADVVIDSSAVEHAQEPDEPLRSTVSFRVPGHGQVIGDFIYVNPMVMDRVEESPLQSPERTFPVDMPYRRDVDVTVRLELPDGYELEEMPADVRIGMPLRGGSFVRQTSVHGSVVTMRTQFKVERTRYRPEAYSSLRTFYQKVVDAHDEILILRRVDDMHAEEGGR